MFTFRERHRSARELKQQLTGILASIIVCNILVYRYDGIVLADKSGSSGSLITSWPLPLPGPRGVGSTVIAGINIIPKAST